MYKSRVNAQHTGAAGELRVCADLLLRGYEVYRNVSSAGVDVVAYKWGRFYRVEVKANGNGWEKRSKSGYDILATADFGNGKTRYIVSKSGKEFRFDNLPCCGVDYKERPDFEESNA